MSVERRPNHLPKRAGVIAEGVVLFALAACSGKAAPAPAPSIDNGSFTPSPTATEMVTPEPTYPQIVPVATFYPTPEPTPTPNKKPLISKDVLNIKRGPNDGKTVYVTFDDCFGAASNTKKVIDTAYFMGARVTFFCVGDAIDDSQQAANMRLAVSYGDELENHTFTHAAMISTDVTFMKNEMANQLKVIRDDLKDPKYKECLVRPPFGYGADNPYFRQAANKLGLRIVTWSFSSGGTSKAYDTSPARVKRIMDTINAQLLDKNGNIIGGQIILMHVRPADIAALPKLIEEVHGKGGTFGLVGDLVGCQNTTP